MRSLRSIAIAIHHFDHCNIMGLRNIDVSLIDFKLDNYMWVPTQVDR